MRRAGVRWRVCYGATLDVLRRSVAPAGVPRDSPCAWQVQFSSIRSRHSPPLWTLVPKAAVIKLPIPFSQTAR